MTTQQVVLPYPWSRLLNEANGGSLDSLENDVVCQRDCWASVVALWTLGPEGELADFGVAQLSRVKGSCTAGMWHFAIPLRSTNSEPGLKPCAPFERPVSFNRAVEESSLLDPAERFAQAVDQIATYFEEAISLCDEVSLSGPNEDKRLAHYRGKAYLRIPWIRLGKRWRRTDEDSDPAPLSLLAKIVRDHGAQILSLARDPRRLLVRQRREERVDRIQELDSHCLLDFIQRPGRTVAEKAGRNQRLMAVTRHETVDTLENRILRDLMEIAVRRGADFSRENAQHRGNSPRVRMVDSFRHKATRSLRIERVSETSRLHGETKPNYVLLKNEKYKKVWRSWCDLREEDKRRRELWSWSRRLWADYIRGWILSGIHLAAERHNLVPVGEADAIISRGHRRGCFFLPTGSSARFRSVCGTLITDIVHPWHFHMYPAYQSILKECGAELGIVRFQPQVGVCSPSHALLVYTFLPLDEEREVPKDQLEQSLDQFLERLPPEMRVLVIIGNTFTDSAAVFKKLDTAGRVHVWRGPVGVNRELETLAAFTLELVGHDSAPAAFSEAP